MTFVVDLDPETRAHLEVGIENLQGRNRQHQVEKIEMKKTESAAKNAKINMKVVEDQGQNNSD